MYRVLSVIKEYKVISALIGGTIALDAGYYALHNFIQCKRAFRVSCTEQGSSVKLRVSQDLRDHLLDACIKLGLEQGLLDRLDVFVCRGIDPVRMGRLSSVSGLDSFLGLPEHFDYKAMDTEQRHSIFFDERVLSLNTSKGRQLYRGTLVLNDDEKRFVLARELLYLTSNAVHVPPIAGTVASAGLGGLLYWGLYGTGRALLDSAKSKMSKGPKYKSYLLYSIGVSLSLVVWCMMAYQWYAAYRKSLDARVDIRAAAAYPNGAVSFYHKLVKRNTLLRSMLGESVGKGYYTVKGNEVKNWVLSDPFLPVNQRWSKLRYNQSIATGTVERQSAAAAAAAE